MTASDGSAPSPAFPILLTIPVAWGEMDSMGHVNNIVYLRWFESARITYFERIGWLAAARVDGIGPILHSTQARFRAPVVWPDTITAGARISELSDDRFTMLYEVRSLALARVAAEGSGVVVSYDYRRGVKAPLSPELRERIAELEGWPR